MDFTSLTFWTYAYYVSEWVIRVVMLVVVPFRRTPEAAKGWLLLILFLPWPGFLLYHFIGRPKYPRWRIERGQRLPELFKPTLARLHASLETLRPPLDPELAPSAVLVSNLGHLGLLGGNQIELLADYDGSIGRLVADIDAAKNHVHLLYYIISDDATAGRVLEALARAVQRGVTCRVLFDYLGSRRWGNRVEAKLAAAGVAVHRVLPVGFWRRHTARADLRNHRKIAVIDGVVGYTGSQNLIDAGFKPGITYEELVVRVAGPAVLQLQALFAIDWFMECEELLDGAAVFPDPGPKGTAIAQVLPSSPDYPASNIQTLVVDLVHRARQRVVITTPYFVPDQSLLVALDTAVRRGVEVHLVVSQQADQYLVSLAQRSYYEELLEAGVCIHLYRDKFLHAKHLSIDDTVSLIGSSNMDIRSFVLNAEVSLVIYDRNITARLRQVQKGYFAGSKQLTRAEWEERSRLAVFGENLARLMSPLL